MLLTPIGMNWFSYATKSVEDESSNYTVAITKYNGIDDSISQHYKVRPVSSDVGFMMGTPDAKQQEQNREAPYSDI